MDLPPHPQFSRLPAKILLWTALATLALPPVVNAYDTQLDDRALHEAYVLGQRNDKVTGDFLNVYINEISERQSGPHIAQIQLLTPYAQVVDQSRQKTGSGYSEQQAIQDYHDRGNTISINIVLMLPAAYPKASGNAPASPASGEQKADIRPENFWQNFQFNLKQNGKTIPSRSLSNKPIQSTATNETPSVLDGENVWLEFDVKDVASDVATVEVVTPESKLIKASFDLKKLR